MRAIALTMTMLWLAACSTDPHLMNTGAGQDGPDEIQLELEGRISLARLDDGEDGAAER